MQVSVDYCCRTGSFRWGRWPKLMIFMASHVMEKTK